MRDFLRNFIAFLLLMVFLVGLVSAETNFPLAVILVVVSGGLLLLMDKGIIKKQKGRKTVSKFYFGLFFKPMFFKLYQQFNMGDSNSNEQ